MQNREDGHKGQRLGGDPSKKICPLLFCVPITEYTAWVISKSRNDSRGQEVQDEDPSTTAFSVSYWRKVRMQGPATSSLIMSSRPDLNTQCQNLERDIQTTDMEEKEHRDKKITAETLAR